MLEDLLLDLTEGIGPEDAAWLLEECVTGATLEEEIDGFFAAAEEMLPSLTSPLDAEMWGSELLGMLRSLGLGPHDVDEIVGKVIVPMARATRRPAALALLVVLSTLGGPESARAATEACRELVAAGLTEPAWAAQLGRPTIRRCWVYRDIFGEQESVYATFCYGRSEHVLCVLIDHGLGGGVKDSYVATHPKRLRRQMTELADDEPVMVMDDLDATEAARKLRDALASEPCPRAHDQIRDSILTAALLESRVAYMSAGAAPGEPAGDASRAGSSRGSSNAPPAGPTVTPRSGS